MNKITTLIFLIIVLGFIANAQQKLFTKLTPRESGIEFANDLEITPMYNMFGSDYFYNGGGVAIGDLNKDGLMDIVFSGNRVDSRIYYNQGNLEFKDMSEKLGFENLGQFVTGVVLADVNSDGWLDIYLSTGLHGVGYLIENKLWINNQGESFTEESEKYGLNVEALGTQAAFFDYDKDGDMDMYALTRARTGYDGKIVSNYKSFLSDFDLDKINNDTTLAKQYIKDIKITDKFYENVNGKFVEKKNIGLDYDNDFFGLGIVTCDLNGDGWTDIYCSNDFPSNDLMYINNGDGTFKFTTMKSTRQISNNAMGVDVNDFDNDNLPDIMVVDMTANDNKRLKANMSAMAPELFYSNLEDGNQYEYMFNTLQKNNGNNTYSQIAFLAGVATTDWSWAPLFADFDNDFDKDLFITNGIRYDMRWTDASDELADVRETYERLLFDFRSEDFPEESSFGERYEMIVDAFLKRVGILGFDPVKQMDLIPSTPLPNYVFENDGDLTLNDVSSDWGLNDPGFSSGAAYADLDNDGDLDLVVNNTDDYSFIYRNNSSEINDHNYIRFKFIGPKGNYYGVNTKVILYSNDETQYQELTLSRGFLSSMEPILHFGIGERESIDSVQIIWLDNKMQTINNPEINKVHEISYKTANQTWTPEEITNQLFTKREINNKLNHDEPNFDDYEREVLLPHQMSKFGPGMAITDLNKDGYSEFYMSGSRDKAGKIIYQFKGNKFITKKNNPFEVDAKYEDMGSLFFDADGDGDQDLYVVSGSNEWDEGSEYYQDRLYINNNGKFVKDNSRIPNMQFSGSVVTGADFDKDGDIDLFIGGRQKPGMYPHPVSSVILRNDGGKFVDVTKEIAPDLVDIGMVSDALWTDYDSDGDRDLMIVGEWMPVRLLKNKNGKFTNATYGAFDKKTTGWWWSLNSGDFDNDGDIDYVAGNLGLNYKYKASQEVPFIVYSDDFDHNGSNDIVLSYFEKGVCYPLRGRSCSSQQVPEIKKKFPTYNMFSDASVTDVYGEEELKEALAYKAHHFASTYFENNGDATFKVKELPQLAQISTMFGVAPFDYNGDGNLDVLTAGNFHEAEIETPRADASIGLLLAGDGKGNFEPVSNLESGFVTRENTRGIALMNTYGNNVSAFVLNNNSPIEVFDFDTSNITRIMNPKDDVEKVEHHFQDGTSRTEELYFGSGYLTQSSRMVVITSNHSKVILHKTDGTQETIELTVN